MLRSETFDRVDELTLSFLRMLQTLQIWLGSNLSTGFELFGHDTEGLIHQLVSLVNAKLSPANDAFTSLTLICLGLLYVNTRGRGSGDRRDGHDPLLKDLKRVCEKAKVEFHLGAPEGRKRHNCSFGRTGEAISLDSWPAMLDEENKSN